MSSDAMQIISTVGIETQAELRKVDADRRSHYFPELQYCSI